jgi:hypothetical protein
MSNGSGLFSDQRAHIAHLVTNKRGGLAGEIDDLRKDVTRELAPMAAMTLDEFTNPSAADAAGLKIATATVAAAVVVTSFLAPGVAALAGSPRKIVFTTAGVTPADAPATAAVEGRDIAGNILTETVTLSQIAGSASTVNFYAELTSVTYPAADGTAATVAIGFGADIGLAKPLKSRAGLAAVLLEIMDGAVVGSGGGGAAATATNQTAIAVNDAVKVPKNVHVVGAAAPDVVSIVADVLMADGVQIIAAQPTYPCKLQFNITDADSSVTAGIATVVGRAWDGTALTEDVDLTGGSAVKLTTYAYMTVTSITISGLVGNAAGDNLGVGPDNAIALPIPLTATGVTVFLAFVDGASEAVGTVDDVAMTIEPTTAPDGTKIFDFYFTYSETATQQAHTHVQNSHTHGPAGGAGGTFALPAASPPFGSYTPATPANGAHDYLVLYEYDPTAD